MFEKPFCYDWSVFMRETLMAFSPLGVVLYFVFFPGHLSLIVGWVFQFAR